MKKRMKHFCCWIRIRLPCALLLVALSPAIPASACIVAKPFKVDEVRNAKVVFRGKLTDYQSGSGKFGDAAILTFKVIQTLLGPERDSWTIRWYNSTFGTPRIWRGSANQIVAAQIRVIEGQVSESADVLQESCAPPFLLDDTETNRAKIEAALQDH